MLMKAQELWDKVFPRHLHVLAAKDEAVFNLVMQRIYVWRRNFATEAIKRVKAFWESDPLYADAEERAAYVQWAVPETKGGQVPAIYEDVDKSDITNPAEHMLLQWSIGNFKAPKGEEEQFSQKYWGVKTVEYVESLGKATEKSWKKIFLKTAVTTARR
ncbi:hypothetical protein HETIRDRAFT_450975 [Heterobasidion irregulare TC 32-1]|uniref:Uncharacterized protein n=1 Tax=Heterobasidion irregulare (strain TC 32-1) TaxID=747525 RepID=W4KC88_HETIT|nr:uncharacterized protein HETIRDRAFT_450975 [Heterobasidion irregulare TC 32-1]ETW83383.1 hypothetical protein HETIRDRAFT_450975 [Heterobasidion irregulare TC 32-1]